jgi:4-hydroxymandelate oxidase
LTEAGSGPRDPEPAWPVSLDELEPLAAERLDRLAYDYYSSGAGDEITLRRNREAFAELRLLPRVLVDVDAIDTTATVLGTPSSMPLAAAPTAFHGLAHPDAEKASAAGAAAADVPFCLSSLSNTSLEDVAAVAGSRWFQLYVFRDRELTRELVGRAEAAGYEAILLTVDAPVLGRRERDIRNRFQLPDHLRIACVDDRIGTPETTGSGLAAYFASQLDASLQWSDLEWLVESSELPVVVKGVAHPADAERAIETGAAGVVVSNHGGRQLDTVPATIELLPGIAAAVAGRGEVLLDGGVRRGTDIAKALCLGASAVLVGRPLLWGLALDGEAGVRRVINMLRMELREAMALLGAPDLASLGPELVLRR